MKKIKKILIANRGEIAVRVIRTARKLGIRTVAVYSEVDSDSLHVSQADESWCIGEVELHDTYLNIEKIIGVAKASGCDAIHPGYGFLSENARFVTACEEAGLIFIGPGKESMRIMGNKIEAREFVRKINIPMTAGVTGTHDELIATARKIGFPVLLKAAAGGGGKGMQIIRDEKELPGALESTSRQAKAYFGDETVYIEKYIEEPRHIEVQILGDSHGNVIHLFERECSIQRRYQKIIEESPSPTLTQEVRNKMGEAAVAIGKAIGYTNAGTIEFLVDRDLNFYFLEMNTRIQVEHPVTEMVTGIDIVEEQINIASGGQIPFSQDEVIQRGHAIECRIYAEDPANNFQPSPGKMTLYHEPEVSGIRIDTGITSATEIKSSFDPMICKLVVHGRNRTEAAHIMLQALNGYIIHGIRTNISFLKELLFSDAFVFNRISTSFCDGHSAEILSQVALQRSLIPPHIPIMAFLAHNLRNREVNTPGGMNIWEKTGYWRNRMQIRLETDNGETVVDIPGYDGRQWFFTINGSEHQATIHHSGGSHIEFSEGHSRYRGWISEDPVDGGTAEIDGHQFRFRRKDILPRAIFASGYDRQGDDKDHVTSPMPGKVIRILAEAGKPVTKGDPVMIIEAMKMENHIAAPRDGIVKTVMVAVNDRVDSSTILIEMESNN